MTHPAIDEDAAARLRTGTLGPGSAIVLRPADAPAGKPTALEKLKASARKAAVPVIARLRKELDRAGAEDLAALRAEVTALRDELARSKAEHAADLAALHEELASARPTKTKPT